MIHPYVPGNGPRDARLVIIGERPGDTEMHERAPMVGRTGERVYRALGVSYRLVGDLHKRPVGSMRAHVGKWLDDLSTRITNVRCVQDETTPIADCHDHLQAELDTLTEARTLLLVGADAARIMTGRDDMAKLHSSVWTRAEVEAMQAYAVANNLLEAPLRLPPRVHTVVISYHPAHAMRGFPQAMPLIDRAIQKALLWSHRETGPDRRLDINLAPTPDEVREALKSDFLSIDIETPRDAPTFIKMVGVAHGANKAVVFHWQEPFISIFKEAMQRPGVVKCGHNFGFDRKAFLANGVTLAPPCYDTIIIESVLRPAIKEAAKRRWLALSTSAQHHLHDWPYHKEPTDLFTQVLFKTSWPDVPDGRMEEFYCALDCISTRRLLQEQMPEVKKLGVGHLVVDVLAPAADALVEMESEGVLIDAPLRKALYEATTKRIGQLTKEIGRLTSEFHASRRARLEKLIADTKEMEAHEIKTHPLFTAGAEPDSTIECAPCETHLDYRGLTRRQKCEGCARVYKGAASLRAKVKDLRTRASRAKSLLLRLGGAFSPTNKDHWIALLFDKDIGYGLEPVAFTDKRHEPKLDDDAVEELQRLYPDVEILNYRVEHQKLERRKKIVLSIPTDEAGYAYFNFSLHHASTGRSASGNDADEPEKYRKSDGGNAQNWKDQDRRIVIPRPGFVWASADYSQIELRDMVWAARDVEYLKMLREGLDVHAHNASLIYGIPADKTRSTMVYLEGNMQPARQGGKKVTHIIDFGGREEKIGAVTRPFHRKPLEEVVEFIRRPEHRDVVFKSLKLRRFYRTLEAIKRIASMPEQHHRLYAAANTALARTWVEAYFKAHPRMKEYQEELIAQASRDGYITNAWGRRMTIYEWRWDSNGNRRPADINDVIAFPAQSNAGEIAKSRLRAMLDVFKAAGDGRMRLFVHDSFDGDIAAGYEEPFVATAKAVLEVPFPEMGEIPGFGYFICPIEVAFGANWGKRHVCAPEKCGHTPADPCENYNPEGLH